MTRLVVEEVVIYVRHVFGLLRQIFDGGNPVTRMGTARCGQFAQGRKHHHGKLIDENFRFACLR